jgi:ABC-type transporter Mla subunit MlaD
MDEYKFESLYEAIRNNEELTKEQKQYLGQMVDELKRIKKELEELDNSNFSKIEALQKLYNITYKLTQNLDAVNTKLKNNVEDLNKIALNYEEKIKDTIKNSVYWINVNPIENEIKNQLEAVKKDIANALEREKDNLDKLSREFKSANLGLTFIKDEIKKNIDKLDETREKLNKMVKNINWKLVIGASILTGLIGAISGTLASQYVFNKLLKEKEKIIRKTCAESFKKRNKQLENRILKIKKEIKELKDLYHIK